MIEALKTNLKQEKVLIKEISSILRYFSTNNITEKEFYLSSLKALIAQYRILNGAVPTILDHISPLKGLIPGKERKIEGLTELSYISPVTREKSFVTINKKDTEKFIQELKISQEGIKTIKQEDVSNAPLEIKTNFFTKISNSLFSRISEKIVPSVPDLGDDLKRANITLLTSTYVSIALLTSILVLIFSFLIILVMFFYNPSMIMWIWIPFVLFIGSIMAFYFYPSSEKSGINNLISQELPFATIHMSAIAGSNVEPTKMFKIIASSKEYPTLGKELNKIMSQIEVYGYDLLTALKNTAKRTSNESFSELLNGIATNISSGGNLKDYLDKKSENFLADYKLERQRYNSMAELFMDVYISILITGPLIMMMLFIIMNIGKFSIGGLSIETLLFLTSGIVVFANIIFIVILDIKQPKT
jgi:flagellar protein FlaJ